MQNKVYPWGCRTLAANRMGTSVVYKAESSLIIF